MCYFIFEDMKIFSPFSLSFAVDMGSKGQGSFWGWTGASFLP
jgi:hypothetical protein